MIEPSNVSPKPGEGGDGSVAGDAPSSVIVIEYRQRGLASRLMPPALILLAALAISSYQRKTPVRPIAPRLDLAALAREKSETPTFPPPKVVFRPQPSAADAGGGKDGGVDKPAASPETPRVDPLPDAAASSPIVPVPVPGPPVADPGPPTRPSPFDLAPVDGLLPVAAVAEPQPIPAPATAAPAPETPPEIKDPVVTDSAPADPPAEMASPPNGVAAAGGDEPSKDEILRDIQREADEKNAQREDLEKLKPRAQAILAAEALAKVHDDRLPFHNDLRQLLKERGNGAGPEIDQLCDQYGRDTPQEVRALYNRALRRAPARMSRQDMVAMMRSIGLPEPVILDYISHGLHKTLNTRGGPRDEDEVRVRAARFLLSIPLPGAPKAGAKPREPRPALGNPVALPARTRTIAAPVHAFPR